MNKRWIPSIVFPAAVMLALTATGAAASAGVQPGRTAPSDSSTNAAASQPFLPAHMGDPIKDVHVEHGFGPDSIPTETSTNWSGYVDTGHSATNGDFSSIVASWNVPEIPDSACPSGNYGYRLGAVWVGLDGSGSSTVEQTGTTSQCHNGSLTYYSWYEMYPSPPNIISSVSPGDHITAFVDFTGYSWHLSLVDNSTGSDFSSLQSCPSGSTCDNYSAEAIAEAPGGCVASSSQVCNGSLYPLADFNFVKFSLASVATDNAGGGLGTSGFTPHNVTMVAGSKVLAKVTTTLSKDGFTDSWKAST
jgi:hypothetical protein